MPHVSPGAVDGHLCAQAAALTNNCATLTPNPKRRANPKQTDHTSPAGSRCTHKDESEAGERPIPNFGGFNEYAIEVRGDGSFSFVYNGATVHEYNVTKGLPLHQVPWYLILNFAVGGPWPKAPSSSTVFPAVTSVDYVRVARPAGAK
jgi:hypothetical protein